ncbi:MAG: signal peptidase I [Candidatus Faecousia sp.]|nr:signal peptidase I [Bacillota bacterium]MDY4219431.1 signal peptidase I [Candidatus Faecousia sp.]
MQNETDSLMPEEKPAPEARENETAGSEAVNPAGPEGEAKPEKEKPEKPKPTLLESCYTCLHDLVYILAALTLIFVFVLRVVSVSGYSMYPTLVNSDYVALLSNVIYNGSDIKDGDVVVALAPRFDDEPLVKRVIATAGETVDIDFEKGIVYVDGVALEEPYINEPTHKQFYDRGVTFPLTVEEGHVFLMGDNRNDSSDSRLALIGQVDTRYILGKVVFIMLPGEDKYQGDSRDFGRIGGVS